MNVDVEIKPCEDCSPQANCIDGQCVCKDGYTGDGYHCTSKSHKFNKLSKVLLSKHMT